MNCYAQQHRSAQKRSLSEACIERTARMRAKDVGEYGDEICGFEDGQEHRVIGYCENCGLPVFAGDDALCVIISGDTIHSSCWDYYASEHAALFTESADTDREE